MQINQMVTLHLVLLKLSLINSIQPRKTLEFCKSTINPNTSNTIGNTIYIIFADLQAYPKGKIAEISTYEESTKNDCELILLVVDSCYATIYCKDKDKLELLYKNARDCGFEDVEYITNENDTKTRLSVW